MEKRRKMTQAERARQFMPFAALRGFEDVIREREKIKEQRVELSDELIAELSEVIMTINKGDMVEIKYYDKDGYVVKRGAVSGIDHVFRTITVVKTTINFADVYTLQRLE